MVSLALTLKNARETAKQKSCFSEYSYDIAFWRGYSMALRDVQALVQEACLEGEDVRDLEIGSVRKEEE